MAGDSAEAAVMAPLDRKDGTRRRFGDLADDIAARLPDREGLVFGASRYTFREVAARIDEAARRLIAAGVGPGEHVALWLNNCDDWIFIAFAVQKIGAVLVPINTRSARAISPTYWHSPTRAC
jgi:acyl-CoA synthetase (AMP-forming)/AMP-acid ligase II